MHAVPSSRAAPPPREAASSANRASGSAGLSAVAAAPASVDRSCAAVANTSLGGGHESRRIFRRLLRAPVALPRRCSALRHQKGCPACAVFVHSRYAIQAPR
ncbi:hypothetical protein HPB50_020778 [Hyalomma asiaticum]|uniref:Uncharacterized protein n=1 Tax=Hyalomma asiaticum TaxID=266040 RepID=A0ACB7TKW6_HYAAI|nr:hypothetical protein HPB50_020778 [Hyalomma asiaticum]